MLRSVDLKAAKFAYHKSLDEFDFASQPSLNRPLVLQLMRGDYMDSRENILLVGASGTGKTHVATALGIAACGQGKRVRFFRVTELITMLMEAREEKQLLAISSSVDGKPGLANPGRIRLRSSKQGPVRNCCLISSARPTNDRV